MCLYYAYKWIMMKCVCGVCVCVLACMQGDCVHNTKKLKLNLTPLLMNTITVACYLDWYDKIIMQRVCVCVCVHEGWFWNVRCSTWQIIVVFRTLVIAKSFSVYVDHEYKMSCPHRPQSFILLPMIGVQGCCFLGRGGGGEWLPPPASPPPHTHLECLQILLPCVPVRICQINCSYLMAVIKNLPVHTSMNIISWVNDAFKF